MDVHNLRRDSPRPGDSRIPRVDGAHALTNVGLAGTGQDTIAAGDIRHHLTGSIRDFSGGHSGFYDELAVYRVGT